MNNTTNYLFNDFNSKFEPLTTQKDKLSISTICNLNTSGGLIEPTENFTPFFQKFLGEFFDAFFLVNANILNQAIYVDIYSYFDSESNKLVERLFLINSNFELFELNENYKFVSTNITFETQPTFFKSNGKLYIFSKENFLLIQKSFLPMQVLSMPKIKNIVIVDNLIVFSVFNDPISVFYIQNTDIENLTISLDLCPKFQIKEEDGSVVDLIVYKNNLFVIQEFAITKITQTSGKITITQNCCICSKILKNSVQCLDDYIVFLTSSGLFLFDGNDTKEIFAEHTKHMQNNIVSSVVFNNKYYLNTKLFCEKSYENVLLEFDIEHNNCLVYKIGNIQSIYKIQSLNNYHFIAIVENDKYRILTHDKNTPNKYLKSIKFNKITFNNHFQKQITKMKILASGSYTLTIKSDQDKVSFNLVGNSEINLSNIKGFFFEFEIESTKSFLIYAILCCVKPVGDLWLIKSKPF